MAEIDSSSQHPLPEALTWPHPNRMCYPQFRLVDSLGRKTDSLTATIATEGKTGYKDVAGCQETHLGNLSFPRDKESLIELRRQLSMELVWLKQAVYSRQQVF